jgi:hypothetical protein
MVTGAGAEAALADGAAAGVLAHPASKIPVATPNPAARMPFLPEIERRLSPKPAPGPEVYFT